LSGVFFTQFHNIDKKVGFLTFKIIIDQKHVGLQKVTIKRLRITGKNRKTVKDYRITGKDRKTVKDYDN